jgi:hypothetical protein
MVLTSSYDMPFFNERQLARFFQLSVDVVDFLLTLGLLTGDSRVVSLFFSS